jgi:hypothetical protein
MKEKLTAGGAMRNNAGSQAEQPAEGRVCRQERWDPRAHAGVQALSKRDELEDRGVFFDCD